MTSSFISILTYLQLVEEKSNHEQLERVEWRQALQVPSSMCNAKHMDSLDYYCTSNHCIIITTSLRSSFGTELTLMAMAFDPNKINLDKNVTLYCIKLRLEMY